MRALHVDFVAARSRAPLPGLALLVLGAAGALWLGARYVALEREASLLEAAAPAANGTPSGERRERLEAARRVVLELGVPWQPLFDSIAAALDARVALLRIQPDPGKKEVRIGGEAKDLAAVLAFAARLERGGVVHGAYLLEHELRRREDERAVRFTLRAAWSPAPGATP
jgi:hypothetical protein